MIPPKSDPRWKQLLTGDLQHSFAAASAAMCVSRNRRRLLQDSSAEAVQKGVDDVHAFFSKFESIVADDLKAIFE